MTDDDRTAEPDSEFLAQLRERLADVASSRAGDDGGAIDHLAVAQQHPKGGVRP